jgi:hypothetical protein
MQLSAGSSHAEVLELVRNNTVEGKDSVDVKLISGL